jgi:hypothetical protein
MTSSLERMRDVLVPRAGVAHRGDVAFRVAVAAAVLVHLPSLLVPFTIDDYAHMAMVDGDYPSAHDGPFGLYDFIDDANRSELVERGIMPWWTHPKLICRFFRPLSSALLWADYRLFGRSPIWSHAHSLLWWTGASFAVYVLLSETLHKRAAQIAAIIFALAPCHVIPLAWIANREALVSTALGAAALRFYAHWRQRARLRDGASATVLFSLAMLAGEYSLCFGGYVAAMEALDMRRRRESLVRRFAGVSVFAIPSLAYLVVRGALHYGARYGGMYHDPFFNFGRFAEGVPRRIGVLLCSGWLGLDELRGLVMPAVWMVALIAAAVALMVVPARRAFGALDAREKDGATWLLGGSLLAMVPMLAVEPSARLLGASMIGISAGIALVLERVWFPPGVEARSGPAEMSALVALALAFVHIVRAPLDTFQGTRLTTEVAGAIQKRMKWVASHARGHSSVVVVRAESLTTAIWAPCMLGESSGIPWRVLSYEAGRVLVLRPGDRSVELVASPRPIFPMGPRQVFRDFDASLRAGDVVQMDGMKATVLQLDKDGFARRVRFDFDRSLDDPSILWLKESDDGFVEQPPPKTGYGDVAQ